MEQENFDLYSEKITQNIKSKCQDHVKEIDSSSRKITFVKFGISEINKVAKISTDFYLNLFNEEVRVAKVGLKNPDFFNRAITLAKTKFKRHEKEIIALHKTMIDDLKKDLGKL